MKTKRLTLCAFFIVLYILGSKITVPLGVIPLTLQTMMIIIAGILLKPSEIFISYGVYFLMGLVGLPVFATGGGIAYVLQPSFGFLLSFPFAASFIAYMKEHYHFHNFLSLYPICLIALLFIYAVGCIYMYGIFNFYMDVQKDFASIIAIGATPFVISDAISIAIGCFAAIKIGAIKQVSNVLENI